MSESFNLAQEWLESPAIEDQPRWIGPLLKEMVEEYDETLRRSTDLVIHLGLAVKHLTPEGHAAFMAEPQVAALLEQFPYISEATGEYLA